MSSTLTHVVGGNTTVYKSTCNPNRGERDGGHRNGRRRGGRYGGSGGRHDYIHPTSSQPNAAVSPPL